jgi:hypothetical protein
MSEKTKQKRVCGLCEKSGHNARTCALNPKNKNKTPSAAPPPVAALAVVQMPQTQGLTAAEERDFGGAVEFEEAVKQVCIDGVALRMSCREFDGGAAFSVDIRREDRGTQRLQLNVEVASKLCELLTWGLQRQAARAKLLPATRANGKAPTTEAR